MRFLFESKFFDLVPNQALNHQLTDRMKLLLFVRLLLGSVVGLLLFSELPLFS